MIYPQSRVPPRPVLSFRRRTKARHSLPSVLDVGDSLLLTSGRVALATALADLGVTSSDSVLVPAFNCTSMLEPISWRNARVVLYKVHPNLEIDMEDVLSKITATTRAVVVVHYFGFPQDLKRIRALCDERKIALIEDCAHAYFGSFEGRPPGSVGDYAIASMMKFYPIYDGGCLVSSRYKIRGGSRAGNWKFQLKSALNLLEASLRYRRLRPFDRILVLPLLLKDWLWARTKRNWPAAEAEGLGPEAADGGFGFNSKWMNVSASWISKVVMAGTSTATLVARRQANYRRLAEALKNLQGCRPLFADLPETVVPYVFPLLVDSPDAVFPRLKHAGVPLYRWEVIQRGVCQISSLYASHLLQIPCHQELRDDELEWMITTITDIVSSESSMHRSAGAVPASEGAGRLPS